MQFPHVFTEESLTLKVNHTHNRRSLPTIRPLNGDLWDIDPVGWADTDFIVTPLKKCEMYLNKSMIESTEYKEWLDPLEEEEDEMEEEVYCEMSFSLNESLSQKEEEFLTKQIFGTSSAEDSTVNKIDNNQRERDKANEEELATKSSDEESKIEVEEQTRPPKRKSLEIDPKLKAESNEKRLKSLKEKIDFEKRQKALPKEAISSGKRVNKRVVFDNGFDDQIDTFVSGEKIRSNDNNTMGEPQPKKAKKLFKSDSEDEDIDGIEDNNKLKEDFDLDFEKKINDKNAEKLIQRLTQENNYLHQRILQLEDEKSALVTYIDKLVDGGRQFFINSLYEN